MSALEQIFRWMHIFMGVMWIGLLYFFNFINGVFAKTLDAETKKKVMPELLPRTLFWFRWGAAWTWITGVLLLLLTFYHSGVVFDSDFFGMGKGWGFASGIMVLLTFATVFIYDFLFKSGLAKKQYKLTVLIALLYTTAFMVAAQKWAGFSYRGYSIHVGAMFGTIMAFNVWFRIWPAQQKIITAIKNGEAPDADLVGLAGLRSKHNTYLSVPLFWTMINSHTTYFSGNSWMSGDWAFLSMVAVIVLGWHIVWHCYKKSAKVSGF